MTRQQTETDDRPMVIELCGEQIVPDYRGGLYWPAEKMLVVSDLHFEKGSSYAARGVLLPPYDTRTTLARLQELVDDWQPETLVALGDSFHDAAADQRLTDVERDAIRALTRRCEFIWIIGNHDPAPPTDLGGRIMHELVQGPLTLRHEPVPLPLTGEIAGHFHPCARLRANGRTVRRRCFMSDERRLVMPAFGAYTGGLNVLDDAYGALFADGFTAWVMGRSQTYPIAKSKLSPDPGISLS